MYLVRHLDDITLYELVKKGNSAASLLTETANNTTVWI